MKYVAAVISFFFCWVAVAIICGIIMLIIFPPSTSHAFAGIGMGARNLPGTILGLMAGVHSAGRALRPKEAE
jgi:hypothetical protein